MALVPGSKPLTHFKLLSFDVYGTLIDWETGIASAFAATRPFQALPPTHPLRDRTTLLRAYEPVERAYNHANPTADYSVVLAQAYLEVARAHGVPAGAAELEAAAESVALSVGAWPCFPDVLPALHSLHKHYRLVVLSNSSPATFGASLAGPLAGFAFDAVLLASEVGSYKPAARNFATLLHTVEERFGVPKPELLHVAQSLYHDHVPASRLAIANVWVDRRGVMGHVGTSEATVNWKVASLAELAEMADKAFEDA